MVWRMQTADAALMSGTHGKRLIYSYIHLVCMCDLT